MGHLVCSHHNSAWLDPTVQCNELLLIHLTLRIVPPNAAPSYCSTLSSTEVRVHLASCESISEHPPCDVTRLTTSLVLALSSASGPESPHCILTSYPCSVDIHFSSLDLLLLDILTVKGVCIARLMRSVLLVSTSWAPSVFLSKADKTGFLGG